MSTALAFAQLVVDGAIVFGDVVGEDLRAASGADAFGLEVVFERVRNAVERATIDAASEFVVGAAGLCEREIFSDGDERVEAGLLGFDAAERLPRQFNGGDFAGAQLLRGCFDGQPLRGFQ